MVPQFLLSNSSHINIQRFAPKLKAICLEKYGSLHKAARAIRCSRSVLSKIVNAKAAPGPSVFQRMLNCPDFNVITLLEHNDNPVVLDGTECLHIRPLTGESTLPLSSLAPAEQTHQSEPQPQIPNEQVEFIRSTTTRLNERMDHLFAESELLRSKVNAVPMLSRDALRHENEAATKSLESVKDALEALKLSINALDNTNCELNTNVERLNDDTLDLIDEFYSNITALEDIASEIAGFRDELQRLIRNNS